MNRKGSTTSIVIATIAGLSVLGVAGYRMMAGDCGSCAITGNETAAVQTVAAEGDSCCALKAESTAAATLVATETGACSDKADCGSMAACETKSDCASSCSGEIAEVELISTTTESTDCGDVCGSACAGDACGEDADACCGKCDKGQELAKAPQ